MSYLEETLEIYRMEIQAGRKIKDANKDAIKAIERWYNEQIKPDLPSPLTEKEKNDRP